MYPAILSSEFIALNNKTPTNHKFDLWFYESCKLGQIKDMWQSSLPKHNNYEDYGLTRQQSVNSRLRYLRSLKEPLDKDLSRWQTRMLLGIGTPWYVQAKVIECSRRVDKLAKDISFNLARLKLKEDNPQAYDIARIKTIPMDKITQINGNRFFQENPFRKENSPSNSLFWYKDSNRFHDFYDGRTGDVIDIFMAINKCTLKEALKELSVYN